MRSATEEGLTSAKERIYGVFDGTPVEVGFADGQTASDFAEAATKPGAIIESGEADVEAPESEPIHRELGWVRSEFTVPDDFDAPLPPEIEDSFYK